MIKRRLKLNNLQTDCKLIRKDRVFSGRGLFFAFRIMRYWEYDITLLRIKAMQHDEFKILVVAVSDRTMAWGGMNRIRNWLNSSSPSPHEWWEADIFRYVYPFVGLVQFLTAAFLCENGEQVLGLHGFTGLGVLERHGLVGHIGLYVVPPGRNLILGKEISFLLNIK